ncbi:hypothetical protein RND81_14G184300 [Saponaria officinalis]|uniref:RRM domain-containing protein n=1 Tax=Saponaria officinalis TaxID=3572 RepID=A0AAW1GS41_SAPOF
MNNLAIFTRRTVTALWSPASQLKCYCANSSPLSAPHNRKLFVGGLSWSVDERSLLNAFSSFGEVTEVKILYDKDTGRSRGFGFVNFTKGDDAKSAREAMDGKAFLGRPIRISFALEKVRGAPIVVPRIQDDEAASRRNRKS